MIRLLPLACVLVLLASCSRKEEQQYAVAQIKTPQGEILFWLYDETPRHKESFIKLANAGYWDSLTFNRVIPDFVAQGGCPDTPEGFSDSPYLLDPEFVDTLRHVYGAVGGGRDNNPGMLTAGCQFYIVQNRDGLARLDDKFTVYGQVFQGMDVVDAIVHVDRDSTDTPHIPVTLDVNIINMTASEIAAKGFTIPASSVSKNP